MATKMKAQIHMEDNIVKDDALEALLEDRQEKKQSASDYRKADKKAKDKIGTIQTAKPFRCGRFIIAESKTEAGHVEFDKSGGTRLTIKTIDGD